MQNTNSKSYRDLVVWQEAKNLVLLIYHIAMLFPKEELYVLSAQMKRATISIASNISEGNQRRSKKDRIRFFNIAQGSLIELGCQLELAYELKFTSKTNYEKGIVKVNHVGYLLTRFIQSEIGRD